MNSGRMNQVFVTVEYRYPRQRLMSGVRFPSLQQNKSMLRVATRALHHLVITTFKTVIALLVASIVANALKPIEYAERGYHAYGGEMLLTLMVFWLALSLMFVVGNQRGGNRREKMRSMQPRIEGRRLR